MRRAFLPDRIFRRVADIDIEADIVDRGFKLVVLDIDGTLKNRVLRRAPIDTEEWARKCREKGLFVCLVSNDRRNRHIEFSDSLGFPLIAAAHKPSPHSLKFVLDEYKIEPKFAVMIGNNPFTDVLCAHRAGMTGYLVRPLETTRRRKTNS